MEIKLDYVNPTLPALKVGEDTRERDLPAVLVVYLSECNYGTWPLECKRKVVAAVYMDRDMPLLTAADAAFTQAQSLSWNYELALTEAQKETGGYVLNIGVSAEDWAKIVKDDAPTEYVATRIGLLLRSAP